MTILLCITVAELIRQILHERDVHGDSIIVSRVRADYFRLFRVVNMFQGILYRIGLFFQPSLVVGVVDWTRYIEAVAVFVFSLYRLLATPETKC